VQGHPIEAAVLAVKLQQRSRPCGDEHGSWLLTPRTKQAGNRHVEVAQARMRRSGLPADGAAWTWTREG